jgi:hypothetical protein
MTLARFDCACVRASRRMGAPVLWPSCFETLRTDSRAQLLSMRAREQCGARA